MKFLTLALTVASLPFFAIAKNVVIDNKTKQIIPVVQIHKFTPIDWENVEKRQNAGKHNTEHVVMLCDDTYYQAVEIELPAEYEGSGEALENVTIETDRCSLKGVSNERYQPAYLQFEEDGQGCTIEIKKSDKKGKKPLVVTYEISSEC